MHTPTRTTREEKREKQVSHSPSNNQGGGTSNPVQVHQTASPQPKHAKSIQTRGGNAFTMRVFQDCHSVRLPVPKARKSTKGSFPET